MQRKDFTHVDFSKGFSKICEDELQKPGYTVSGIESKHNIKINRYIKRAHSPSMETFCVICTIFKRCPVRTFIDIAVKIISPDELIDYIQSKYINN